MRPYRIVHIPAYRDPYQSCLLSNLRILGLDVRYGRGVRLSSVSIISPLLSVIKNFKVHVLHLHWQTPFFLANSKIGTILKSTLFLIELLIIRFMGTRVVWTVHNIKNHENRYKELEIFFSRILAHLADAIVVLCNYSKYAIQKTFCVRNSSKIVIIPHGALTNFFENTLSKTEARNLLNLSQTDIIFVFFGLIRPYKGVLELLDSFKKLNDAKAKLIIAGRPQNEQLLEDLKRKSDGNSNVKLTLRAISSDEVQIYLNAADIMVLPYRDVLNSGNVFLGMSFGKPIIAPRLGCIPEVLDRSGSFLYESVDKDGLLNAMRRALASRRLIPEMARHNLRLAQKLDWQPIAVATNIVYENCFRKRTRIHC